MDLSSSHRAPGAPPSSEALAALLDCEADLEALERALLAAAVHPEGGGCTRAWLLRWDARRGLLEGWRAAARGADPGPLAAAIARARRAAPGDDAEAARVRAWAEAPERLDGAAGEAWLSGAPAAGEGGAHPGAPWSDEPRVGAVVLRRGPQPYGVLVGGGAPAPAALEWMAAAAALALGAQARAAEARRRARQAAALAEFARAAVSALNLAEALHLLARLGAHGPQVRGAAVYRAEGAPGALRLEVAHGPAPVRDAVARALAPVAADVVEHLRPLAGAAAELPAAAGEAATEVSVWAAQPIVAYGRAHAALVVWDGPERHPNAAAFERGDLEFLAALGDVAALLFEHARRLADLEHAERQRRDLAGRLRDQDRLVALGELAGRVAHEARNPLASITAFARRVHRELAAGDPQRDYLEIVLRESERLEAMLQEQLEYARLEPPRLALQSLNAVVQQALQRAAETLVRRRVRLVKKLAPDLPELLLDGVRIRRVVENVTAFALESLPLGGRLRVETRRAQGFVMVEIAHDGAHAAGDLLEHLFVPFTSGQASGGGAAIGLGVAQQIVREHGGEIRVRSEGEWSAVFAFTLPVLGNQDRRRATDRRGGRRDRRRSAPEG